MAQVKTDVSFDAELFESAEHLAQEFHMTRSGLYAQALKELIERRNSQKLLDDLNAAYDELPDRDDEVLHQSIRRTMPSVADPWE